MTLISMVMKINITTRGVATGRGGVGVSCPPIVPNSEQIRVNIQKIFYKFIALKAFYSLQIIQLKSKYE